MNGRDVYGNGIHFVTVNELYDAIFRSWDNAPSTLTKALTKTLILNIFDVINKNGVSTHQ